MPEHLSLEDILDRNPQINRERLEESRDLLRRLRSRRDHRKGYDLVPPFGGRSANIRDDAGAESRRVKLRRPPDGEDETEE
jgi:hypothetical protein